jgi:hypothetical protein
MAIIGGFLVLVLVGVVLGAIAGAVEQGSEGAEQASSSEAETEEPTEESTEEDASTEEVDAFREEVAESPLLTELPRGRVSPIAPLEEAGTSEQT